MKRLLIIISFLFLLNFGLKAQAPQAIDFQAVAAQSGEVLNNQNISIRASLLTAAADGPIAFSETHSVLTSEVGEFSLAIGQGLAEQGSFSDLNWANEAYYLQIEMDPNNGSNFELLGTTHLLAVPYALFTDEAGEKEMGIAGPEGLEGPEGEAGPQGATGATGPQGATSTGGEQGAQGPQGPAGATGATGATGPQGPAGLTGEVGPVGPTGNPGPDGPDGIESSLSFACWDTNANGTADPSEDINEDGLIDVLDCQGSALIGATGATGPQGPQGLAGLAGESGTQGPPGPQGDPGLAGPAGPIGENSDLANKCWDTNHNLIAEIEEDINDDCLFDAYDCISNEMGQAGPSGQVGATGPQGPQGNTGPKGDQGPQGPQGPQGTTGPNGILSEISNNCWDTNINGTAEPEEDINEDGVVDVLDCIGVQGLVGATGATGPQGPVGFPGSVGAQGPIGLTGPPGPPGPQGESGPSGISYLSNGELAGDHQWIVDCYQLTLSEGTVGIGLNGPATNGLLEIGGTLRAADVYSNSLLISSDFRYKKNIQPIQFSLSQLLQIKAYEYDYRVEEFPQLSFTNQHQIGFIAQEIGKVFPSLVQIQSNGYQTVDYIKMGPILLEASKLVNADIEELKEQTQSLEANSQRVIEHTRSTKASADEMLKQLQAIKAKLEKQ